MVFYQIIRSRILMWLARDDGRYILVGGIIYAFDFLIFSIFVLIDSDLYVIGNIVARILGALLGFFLHRNWTFKTEYKLTKKNQLFMYLLLLLGNIFASSFLLFILVDLLLINELYARIITDAIIIIFTFLISKFFIFMGVKNC